MTNTVLIAEHTLECLAEKLSGTDIKECIKIKMGVNAYKKLLNQPNVTNFFDTGLGEIMLEKPTLLGRLFGRYVYKDTDPDALYLQRQLN